MSLTGKELKDSPMKLLPHQTALLETVFSPASKRVILLRGDVGLGKSTALVALVGRLLQERPSPRALLLVPAALVVQFVEMLREAGIRAEIVDRYLFRAMLDSTTGQIFWPRVTVLSRDFAKQPDILDSLAETHWDLLIADEAHSIRGARAEALRRIGTSAERVVLATRLDVEAPDGFPAEDATVVEWRRDLVVDQDGKPLDAAPRPLLHEVTFSLSPAELSLMQTVGDLRRAFETGRPPQPLIAKLLLRVLRSSPAALERALQNLVAGLEVQGSTDASLEASEEEMLEEAPAGQMDRPTAGTVVAIAGRALQEIEAIRDDSKLEAFSGLLSRLDGAKIPSRRTCVLTEHVGTLYYLAAEIEARDIACQLLHGGMSAEDRRRSLVLFSIAGGILVVTMAVTEGVELREVTDLVLYDVPGSKAALQQVFGRFDRFGRRSQLDIHVLAPSNSADSSISDSLGLLREFLDLPTRAQPTP